MEDPSHNQSPIEYEEIRVLLRTLRIEATPEANFEERFLWDFRERLAREAVCRPARALLWEHVLQAIHNLGGRKLAWSLSSFGVGALCMGALFWQQQSSMSKNALAAQMCELDSSAASLRPGDVQNVASTSVTHQRRRSYTDGLSGGRLNQPSYLAGLDDEGESRKFFTPTTTDSIDMGLTMPGLISSFAH